MTSTIQLIRRSTFAILLILCIGTFYTINALDGESPSPWSVFIKVMFFYSLAIWGISRILLKPWKELADLAPTLSENRQMPSQSRWAELSELYRNITRSREKQTQKQLDLEDQREQQESIIQSMKDGLITLDHEGNIVAFNRAAGDLFSLRNVDAKNQKLSDLVRSSELVQCQQSLSYHDQPFDAEILLFGGTLQERIFQVRGNLFRNPSQVRHSLIVFTDVTKLRTLESMRRDFVANVSHELKTPLTSIKGYTETLADMPEFEDDLPHRFLNKISHNADRLNQIIEDLLTLSRIEQNGLSENEMERVSFQSIFDQLKRDLTPENKDRVLFSAKSTQKFIAHGPLLHQALYNLMDNALKYSSSEHVSITSTIQPEGQIVFEVIDQGKGIPQEHLPHLMERFYRVDKARSREQGGTGLGLSIVKHIVEAHGGEVDIWSALGQGSRFKIILPARLTLEPNQDSLDACETPTPPRES